MSNATSAELRRTPLYDCHVELEARIVPFAGWQMPIQYAGISKEHKAVREAAGLFDVCHMGELLITGAGALKAVNRLITNDLNAIEDGRALYTCCCNPEGTILDDLIVYRRSESEILIVCNASNREKIAGHVGKELEGSGLSFEDQSDATALIALQGPKALGILGSLNESAKAASELKSFRFADATIAGHKVTVARTGYTGENGVEIFAPAEGAADVWRALMAAGKDEGLQAVGLGARDTLRLEARLSLYGNDIDETTNPLEAGLGWVVKFAKEDFIGKSALQAIKEKGLERKLVGFEMLGRGVGRHGYKLLDLEGNEVGICTSGGPSPTLGKRIGLGYLPVAMAEVGTKFLVDCRGKQIEAVVVKPPFYKRPK